MAIGPYLVFRPNWPLRPIHGPAGAARNSTISTLPTPSHRTYFHPIPQSPLPIHFHSLHHSISLPLDSLKSSNHAKTPQYVLSSLFTTIRPVRALACPKDRLGRRPHIGPILGPIAAFRPPNFLHIRASARATDSGPNMSPRSATLFGPISVRYRA